MTTLHIVTGGIPMLGIDCRFARTKAGLGRYTRELVQALLKRDDPWRYALFVKDENNHGLGELRTKNYQLVTCNARHYSLQEHLLLPSLLKKHRCALLHSLHFNVPWWCPVPFIATIHDLTLHHYPNQAPIFKCVAYRALMRRTVKRARHIITISEFTKGDLLKRYSFLARSLPLSRRGESWRRGVPSVQDPHPHPPPFKGRVHGFSDKITVIPEGVSPVFHPADRGQQEYIRDSWHLPQNYFLYVGNAKEHKNVQTLIDAFNIVCKRHPDPLPSVAPAGAKEGDPTLILVSHGKELSHLQLVPNVRIIEEIEDMHLRALYTGAVAFVLPSLYEGLGLPCLEAMACGCPVIASNCASIPEVCSDAAFLVEPTVEALSNAMLQILKLHPEGREREEIIMKGLRRAAEFTWEKTAELTASVYTQVLR